MTPSISGVHHVTFVVTDLDAGVEWFGRVLGTRHEARFDHHDESGALFGVVVSLDGFPGMIELRIATPDYLLTPGYDPVTLQVADDAELDEWFAHLEHEGVDHTPIKRRRTGRSIEFRTPDGVLLRLFTAPAGGFAEVPFQEHTLDH
jgi:catechol 2,3-dioxygenase-like lactoylglutathione lyase family enzyme